MGTSSLTNRTCLQKSRFSELFVFWPQCGVGWRTNSVAVPTSLDPSVTAIASRTRLHFHLREALRQARSRCGHHLPRTPALLRSAL